MPVDPVALNRHPGVLHKRLADLGVALLHSQRTYESALDLWVKTRHDE
jgi:hypothetical protein